MRAELDRRAMKANCAQLVGGIADIARFAPAIEPIGGVD